MTRIGRVIHRNKRRREEAKKRGGGEIYAARQEEKEGRKEITLTNIDLYRIFVL